MKKLLASIMAVVLLISLVPLQVNAENSVDVSSKLIGQWNFDDQTTNDSAGTNHATLMNNAEVGTATYVDGIKGKALKLSEMGGADKLWLSVPYAAFGDNKDSFTISLWYNATGHNTAGENGELFSLYNSSAEKFLFYGAQMDGNPNAFSMKWDGTYGYANVIGSYKENEWVNLIYCVDNVDGKSKITAYVNGAAVEVDQGGEWANSLMSQLGIDTFTIGGKNPYKGGPTPNCLFYGSVDEIELYAGTLNAQEALYVYDNTLNPPAPENPENPEKPETTKPVVVPGLIGAWGFNGTLADTVGGNNATLYDNADTATPSYVEGIHGQALQLSQQGGAEKLWLSIPYSVFAGHQDNFTITLWYKATGHNTAGENSELFSLYNSKAEKFLFYGAHFDGNPNAFSMKWDGTYGYANVIGSYKENEWINLTYCVSNVDGQSKITAYVNGKAVEVDQGGEWANSLMSQLGIDTFTIGGKNPYKGGPNPSCLFYGLVDEVQLYDHALTAEEAMNVYNNALLPYTPEGNPPTGDSTPVVLLSFGMLMSAAAILVCVSGKKRRSV